MRVVLSLGVVLLAFVTAVFVGWLFDMSREEGVMTALLTAIVFQLVYYGELILERMG